MKKRVFIAFPTLLLAVTLGIVGFAPANDYFDIARNLDIFTTLFKEVNAYYVDEVEPEPLIRKGIDSMLASLDPYTTYIPEEDAEDYRSMSTGQYGGVGVIVGIIDSTRYVTMLHKGYAAHKAGIRIGDEIIEVDGKSTRGELPGTITNRLKGKPGTSVQIIVKRPGQPSPVTFDIKREKIEVANVPYATLMKNGVGYILVTDFTFGASKEVTKALNQLKAEGATSIILDLRSNPGGLLNEAVNVSNVFIPKGKEIVSTKGKVEEWNKSYKALNMPADVDIPLAILINNVSASASEIVAGVVQDYDRGVLIGRETFGKGLVQTTRPLKYNAQLKVTTAKYYTPSGRCIQRLDYANKNNNGQATAIIVDSLQQMFKTSNGREVHGGGGLQPDIKTEGRKLAPVIRTLVMEGYIFRYANEYCQGKSSLPLPRNFQLTDGEYLDFKNWVKKQNFEYQVTVEEHLELLEDISKEELIYEKLESGIEEMKSNIAQSKLDDLDKFEEEIRLVLQKEIASRYYLFEGDIEATIFNDVDVNKAIELLSDSVAYAQILAN